MKVAWGLILACALLGAGSSCADPRDGTPIAVRRHAIIDGEASGGDDDAVLMIRAVLEDEREVICSASLVAPNLLLTARHCVSYLVEGMFSCSVEGELVNGGDGAGELGLHIPPESIEVYGRETPRDEPLARGQQTISTLSETICNNDLAFVVLDRALDLPVLPLRLGRSAEFGELGMMVGFGLETGQLGIDYREQPRLRKAGLVVAGVGPDSLEEGVTTVAPRSLIVDGPCGCIGDSGGPLMAESSGAVLGVYSLQQGESCTADDVRQHLVHVPPFQRLILDAFAAAGAEPLPEPTVSGGAGGASGEAPSGAGGEMPGGAGGGGNSSAAESGSAGENAVEPAAPAERDDSGCAVVASGVRRAGRLGASLVALALVLLLAARRARQACRRLSAA
ncbi:MAG TPA: trypsin-like serine protease [Polyangiaceae bacterium]|nr:trypsin-like serine protease [Polyangiaceae bacterium]